ncbi:MAG: hypothetical protein ABIF82_12295 [Planctomycetota bacterium]
MSQSELDDDLACCPDCGADVYLHASRCPRCGNCVTPTLNRKGSGRGIILAVIAVITLAVFLFLVLFN